MGNRSTGETLSKILAAFFRARTWSQADLARHCGVSVRAVRARLLDLQSAGVHLENDADPPHVYWSIRKGWFPTGRLIDERDAALIARLLKRLPPSKSTARAIEAVTADENRSRQSAAGNDQSDEILQSLEDSARSNTVARIDYFTASRGDRAERDVSVHRVLYGDRARVVATCHRSGTLKFFRVDEIARIHLVPEVPFRPEDRAAIDSFLESSLDGFRGAEEPVVCRFSVQFPEANWVKRNLPRGSFEATYVANEVCFTASTAALDPLARFVVGLGGAARAQTPELRKRVLALAGGAIGASGLRKVSARPVRSNRTASSRGS